MDKQDKQIKEASAKINAAIKSLQLLEHKPKTNYSLRINDKTCHLATLSDFDLCQIGSEFAQVDAFYQSTTQTKKSLRVSGFTIKEWLVDIKHFLELNTYNVKVAELERSKALLVEHLTDKAKRVEEVQSLLANIEDII